MFVFVLCCFLLGKPTETCTMCSHTQPKPLLCFYRRGSFKTWRCSVSLRAFCERALPLASSPPFNGRLLCPVMLHQFETMKHFGITLVRNEII